MQTSITFLSAEAPGNSAKQNKPNSIQSTGNSFKQVLSKEISSKQNTSSATSVNKAENNAGAKIANTEVEQTTANNKQIKKEDDTDNEVTSKASNQTENAQLIAFVENLGQFPLKTPAAISESPDDKVQLDGTNILNATVLTKRTDISPSVNAGQLLQEAEKKLPPADPTTTAMANSITSDVANLKQGAEIKFDAAMIGKDLSSVLKNDAPNIKVKGLTSSISDQVDKHNPVNVLEKQAHTIQPTSDRIKEVPIQTPKLTEDLTSTLTAITPTAQNFAQQFAISSNQMNTSSAPLHLTPHVGTPAWDQAVGQKVVWMVAGGQQTAELTLNPPDLGPLQVVISVNNDQANASFFSAQPEVRDALESALPKLRQMMNDAGVQLSGFSVSAQTSNQGGQFSGERPSAREQNNANKKIGESSSSVMASTSKMKVKEGLVDTFV